MSVIALVAPMPHFNPATNQWELPAGMHPCSNAPSRPTKAPTTKVYSGPRQEQRLPHWESCRWGIVRSWKHQSKRLRQHR